MELDPPPAAAPIRAEGRILGNRSEQGANHRLTLSIPGWPVALPGQFAMLSPGAVSEVRRDDPLLPRPMAVYRQAATGDGANLEILYRVEGRGTALLAQGRVGDRVLVVGPLGRAFPLPSPGDRVIVVGGGTGVASLFGLAAAAADSETGGALVSVVLGARSATDLMAREDFAALPVDLRIATEDGSEGERGLVTGPLEALLAEGAAVVYCCGPTAMMRRCAEMAAERDVRCIVSLENTMACGFGVCLGCAAPRARGDYALVCRDGPIFDAREIDWDGLP